MGKTNERRMLIGIAICTLIVAGALVSYWRKGHQPIVIETTSPVNVPDDTTINPAWAIGLYPPEVAPIVSRWGQRYLSWKRNEDNINLATDLDTKLQFKNSSISQRQRGGFAEISDKKSGSADIKIYSTVNKWTIQHVDFYNISFLQLHKLLLLGDIVHNDQIEMNLSIDMIALCKNEPNTMISSKNSSSHGRFIIGSRLCPNSIEGVFDDSGLIISLQSGLLSASATSAINAAP